MKKCLFEGCATALITPFKENTTEIDHSAFYRLLDNQLKNGVDALVIAGTTGEAPVLSKAEKNLLLKNSVEYVQKRVPVIAGTGSNSTVAAVEKSNDAEKQGVDGLLIVTPYYNKATQDGIIEHYKFISDRVSTPMIVYNVPSRTGLRIQPETYRALSELKNVVAVKEADTDIAALAKAVSICPDLCFYSGNDDLTIQAMSVGAKGVISVVSNLIPEIMHRVCRLMLNNDPAGAVILIRKYYDLINCLFSEVNPIPVKAACANVFGFDNYLRLPLTKLSNNNMIKLKNELIKTGLVSE